MRCIAIIAAALSAPLSAADGPDIRYEHQRTPNAVCGHVRALACVVVTPTACIIRTGQRFAEESSARQQYLLGHELAHCLAEHGRPELRPMLEHARVDMTRWMSQEGRRRYGYE